MLPLFPLWSRNILCLGRISSLTYARLLLSRRASVRILWTFLNFWAKRYLILVKTRFYRNRQKSWRKLWWMTLLLFSNFANLLSMKPFKTLATSNQVLLDSASKHCRHSCRGFHLVISSKRIWSKIVSEI